MKPTVFPWIVGLVAAVLAAGYAIFVRLPLPFDGFSTLTAAFIAAALTLSLVMMAPAGWIWTDAERLRHAFAKRHGMSELRSGNVFDAIASSHLRAERLRRGALLFAPPLDQRTSVMADRLDEIARDLFYNPDSLSVHRQALVRSELIEEAVLAHAKLRRRGRVDVNSPQIAQSRNRLASALTALEGAFDDNENRLANQLVQQVEISSATAETLLRRPGG